MRLTPKLIDETVSEVAGEDVLPLIKELKNKKNVSEFKLAESIKQEINTTRNMLYRLHSYNLVSFIRKKDKKKGWYIYYWTFDTKQIKFLHYQLKRKKIVKLNERLEREESSQFFACDNKCVRLDFDQTVNFQFKCPECGNLVNQENNQEKINGIKQEIEVLTKELEQDKKNKKK